jgi:hypothetical protein
VAAPKKDTTENKAETAPESTAENAVAVRTLDLDQLAFESRSQTTTVTDDQLRDIRTADDVNELLQQVYGDVIDVTTTLGSGFTVLDDKDELVGEPFTILATRVNLGDFGTHYMSMLCTDDRGGKWIVNDGGAGIVEAMRELITKHGRFGGFRIPRGLRKSDYDTCVDCKRGRNQGLTTCPHCQSESTGRGKATTYYFDLTPA